MQKSIFLKVLVLLLGTQMSLSAKSIIPHFTTGLDDNHSYQIGINWLWLKQKSPNSFSNNIDGSNHDGLTTKTKNVDYIDKNLLKRHITEIENEEFLLGSGYEVPHFLAKNKMGENELEITNFNTENIKKDISIKKPSYENKDWNLKDMLPNAKSTNPLFNIPTVGLISMPDIAKPKDIDEVNINIKGSGALLSDKAYYLKTDYSSSGDQGNFSQVTLEKGTFLKISSDYKKGFLKIKDYKATKPLFYKKPIGDSEEQYIFNANDDEKHFLYTLRTAPYNTFKRDVKIYMDSKSYNTDTRCCDYEFGFAVVGETDPNTNFEKRNISEINQGKKLIDVALPYFMPKDLTINDTKDKSKVPLVYFENEGIAEIGKTAKGFLMMVVRDSYSSRLHIYNNSGDIVLLTRDDDDEDKKAVVFFHSPDVSKKNTSAIYTNTGNINLFGMYTVGYLATAREGKYLNYNTLSFINDGNFVLNGSNSIGMAIAGDRGDLQPGSNVHTFKPIILRGDKAIGFYNENDALNEGNKSFSTMKVVIGDKGNETDFYESKIVKGNQDEPEEINIKEDDEDGIWFDYQSNIDDNDEESVDNAIAMIYNPNSENSVMDNFVRTDIQINAHSTNGIGIYAKSGTIKLLNEIADDEIANSFHKKIVEKIKDNFKNDTNHTININGGKNNVALYSADKSKIIYNGNININGGKDFEGKESTDNRAILATDHGEIEFQGKLNVGKEDSLITSNAVVYSDNAKVTIKNYSDINMNLADNSNGFYASNSSNPANKNPKNSQPQITIEEGVNVKLNGDGVGIVAGNGGHIDLSGATIEATGLKSALASIGNTSYINAQNAVINYSGNSYATYSSQKDAKINLDKATIKLKGNSYGIALDYDKLTKNYDVKGLVGKVKIEPLSDKVNIFTIKDYKDLKSSLFYDEGSALNLKDQDKIGSDFSYKIDRSDPNGAKATLALIDGLENFLIDSDIDKSLAGQSGDKISDMDTDDKKIAFNFAKNIKIQRANITLDSGKTVKADMSKDELKNLSMNKPFAIAVSAGPNAKNKDETSITLKDNSKVIVNSKDQKEDAGVGLYIDFGRVNTEKKLTNKSWKK